MYHHLQTTLEHMMAIYGYIVIAVLLICCIFIKVYMKIVRSHRPQNTDDIFTKEIKYKC